MGDGAPRDAAADSPGGPRAVAVLLNDDLLGEALATSLRTELAARGRPDLNVVDSARAESAAAGDVAIVVTDHDGPDAAALLADVLGGVPQVLITEQPDPGGRRTVSRLAGVSGIVDAVTDELPPAGGVVDTQAAGVSEGDFRRGVDRLTPRRREVMLLLAAGHSLDAIGRRLQLSRRTVANVRYDVLRELGVRTNAELTRLAIRCGLVRA